MSILCLIFAALPDLVKSGYFQEIGRINVPFNIVNSLFIITDHTKTNIGTYWCPQG